jgi:hypothetical protein
LRDREIYPDASGDGARHAEYRKPTSCDRLPVHRSESPTGYSSAGCSPAEPASASPVTDNRSPNPIQRANQIALLNLTARCRQTRAPRALAKRGGCHLYFARRVSSLSCADILVSARSNVTHPLPITETLYPEAPSAGRRPCERSCSSGIRAATPSHRGEAKQTAAERRD